MVRPPVTWSTMFPVSVFICVRPCQLDGSFEFRRAGDMLWRAPCDFWNSGRSARKSPNKNSADESALFANSANRGVGGLFPTAFVETIGATLWFPTRWKPRRICPRRDHPVAGHPFVTVVTPGPVAADPDMVRRWAGGHHLLLRRRRCLSNDNRALCAGGCWS